ncbi:MAG: AMP-binding protein, partial [Planctomycetes bacterium]|nr:AMP-binding protein [Planctomycetota bacterium]
MSAARRGAHGVLLAAMASRAGRTAQRWQDEGGAWRTRTHGELRDLVLRTAAGLRARGVRPADRVGLVADNGPWWPVADLGILAAGACDVPRGADSTPSEIGDILDHSGARACLVLGAEAERRALAAPGVRERIDLLVRLDAARGEAAPGVLSGEEFLEEGAGGAGEPLPPVVPDDVASVIYTSGTTGRPKGVTLLHGNFLHQLDHIPGAFDIEEGDVFLVMLPPWHCFERIVEYVCLLTGGEMVHSHPRELRRHLPEVRPSWMASVPRVWEMVLALSGWQRLAARDPERAAKALRAALGGRLRRAVCGGGRIPDSVDRAYNDSGIPFLVGYGLTETAPVLTVRRPGANRTGTLGSPLPETGIRVVDRETGAPVAEGAVGVLQARGPQVMRGYWRDPDLTERVLLPGGWFDTGDLGRLLPGGEVEFHGRSKDTIVLRGGEKVEPSRLEDRLLESPLLEQVVIVGSDEKVLGALAVPRAEA